MGAAAFERLDTFFEQHVANLGFRVVPEYQRQTAELLDAAVESAREISIRTLQMQIAACDTDQIEGVNEAGFVEEARLRDRLRTDNGWTDILIYTRTAPGTVSPVRKLDDYYGARKSWQKERVEQGRRRLHHR